MELRRLRYFLRVAEDGSLTRSAGVLRIVQPALSRQMRLLEEELGVKLFVRTTRGMQLTEHGEQLQTSVAGPLRELELAIDAVRDSVLQPSGNLVIGMPPGLAELFAIPAVELMERAYPALTIRIIEGPTGSLVDWLNRGLVDLALMEEASRDHRIEDRLLAELPLWLIGPSDSGLAGRPGITLDELARLPLILPSHHMGIRGALDDASARFAVPLNARLQADAPRLVRDLILGGKGYGVMPTSYCRTELATGSLSGCPIAGQGLSIAIHLSLRRHGRINPGHISQAADMLAAMVVNDLSVER